MDPSSILPHTPDLRYLAQVIQLAVAPVFLLAGLGAFLNVCAGRLARIITDIVRQAARDAGRDDAAAAAMAASADDFVRSCFTDDTAEGPIKVHVNNESIQLDAAGRTMSLAL